MLRFFAFILVAAFSIKQANSTELKVAVASNFKSTAQKIAQAFEQKTGHKVTLIGGSTGALYSLIYHGAPYDIFLSADQERPQKLIKNELAYTESLMTYALGQLAFWMPQQTNITTKNITQLIKQQTGKLAIANPRLAPYGKSSLFFIKKNVLQSTVKNKLIKGNNITQTLQFVASGNAQSGFVSFSELLHAGITDHFVLIEPNAYPPIKQQGVILNRTKHLSIAQEFMTFLGNQGCDIILMSGYSLPQHESKGSE